MTHSQSWHETEVSGRWERPLSATERLYANYGQVTLTRYGKEHFTITSVLKLAVDPSIDLPSRLRRAWLRLRFQQPSIACTADVERSLKVYVIPDRDALDAWLAETFLVSRDSPDTSTLFPTLGSVAKSTLSWLPSTSELMFRAPHWCIDGMGTVRLWDALLPLVGDEYDGSLAWGNEVSRLAPTMEELWGYDGSQQPEMVKEANDILAKFAANLSCIGPPSTTSNQPGKCASADLELDEPMTAAIVSSCKRLGVSVTAAVETAFIFANVAYADPSVKDKDFHAMHSFDMRPYLPRSRETSDYAGSAYFLNWPFHLPLPSSFGEAANRLHDHYQTVFKANERNRELSGYFMATLGQMASSPEFLAAPPSATATVSSLGIIDRHIRHEYVGGQVTVNDFDLRTDVVRGPSTVYLYSFRGRLRFQYVFNDGHWERSVIEGILRSMNEILLEELVP